MMSKKAVLRTLTLLLIASSLLLIYISVSDQVEKSVVAVSVVILSISILLYYYSTSWISVLNGMTRMNDVVSRLKDGDISFQPGSLEKNALSETYTLFNQYFSLMRELIGRLRNTNLNIAVKGTAAGAAMEKVMTDAENMAGEAAHIASSIMDANIALNEIRRHIHSVYTSIDANVDSAKESLKDLYEVRDITGGSIVRLSAFSTTVHDLGNMSASIKKVTAIIQDFSNQTNLIAINAAIEAAKAGRFGKGFNVVADEVKKLSQNVRTAAEEISENITEIITLASVISTETGVMKNENEKIGRFVDALYGRFKNLVDDYEKNSHKLNGISTAVDQISATHGNINENTSNMGEISRDVVSRIETSNTSVRELSEITEKSIKLLSMIRTGKGRYEELLDILTDNHARFQHLIGNIHKDGNDVFDQNYMYIEGTNPPQFNTGYYPAFKRAMQGRIDEIKKSVKGCAYAVCVDRNGYTPVQPSESSMPPTGDYKTDLIRSRDRRIFFESALEKKRARNTAPLWIHTYARDTGELLFEMAKPIFIDKKHWGFFIMGFNPEKII